MTPKFTLVPSVLFSEEKAGELLSKVVLLDKGEPLSSVGIPEYDATLIYEGQIPEIYNMLRRLPGIPQHNKLLASLKDGLLYLAIAHGDALLLANCYKASDFTTAEYYIFSALKKLQINPEISILFVTEQLAQSRILSLCSYFKSVEVLP